MRDKKRGALMIANELVMDNPHMKPGEEQEKVRRGGDEMCWNGVGLRGLGAGRGGGGKLIPSATWTRGVRPGLPSGELLGEIV